MTADPAGLLYTRVGHSLASLMVVMVLASVISPKIWGAVPAIASLVIALIALCKPSVSDGLDRKSFLFFASSCALLLTSLVIVERVPGATVQVLQFLLQVFFGFYLLHLSEKYRPQASVFMWLLPIYVFALIWVGLDLYSDMEIYGLLRDIPTSDKLPTLLLNKQVCILTVLFWPVFYLCGSKYYNKNYQLLLGLLLVSVLVVSDSQAAQLGFIGSTLFYFYHRCSPKTAVVILAAVTFSYFIFSPLLLPILFDVFKDAKIDALAWGSPLQRLEIWGFVSEAVLEAPVFGYGAYSSSHTVFDSEQLYHPLRTISHPHNVALQIWFEFGAIGIAFVCAVLLAMLKAVLVLPRHKQRVILCCFVVCLVMAATGRSIWQGWWVGLLFGVASIIAFSFSNSVIKQIRFKLLSNDRVVVPYVQSIE